MAMHTCEPGDVIGIIGGGQLGRMLAMSAGKLGFQCVVLDPAERCPAAQVANDQIVAAYDDLAALKTLAERCNVITYEFENVPCDALSTIAPAMDIFPPVAALKISQDRLAEKNFLNAARVPTAPYFDVDRQSIGDAIGALGGKGILKTRTLGYDGKGQVRLTGTDVSTAMDALESLFPATCILEGFVAFDCEISVIAARAQDGTVACFEPAENVHREGILRTSTVPSTVPEKILREAQEIAGAIVEKLDYVGVIGIEFFVLPDGSLLVNEFAPRVHNSGHWTESACLVSQFDQHIRAIAGLPLGNPQRHSDCVMENLIGDDVERVPEILKQAHVALHLYGKESVRPGRKMGHFNRLIPR